MASLYSITQVAAGLKLQSIFQEEHATVFVAILDNLCNYLNCIYCIVLAVEMFV